jgi:DNA-directed RNA polymerase subunit alpha
MIPLPSQPKVVLEEGNRAVFEIEGLYPGYGQTIGNSLRRVLLSSLKGAAITSVKIEGVGHEFSTIEGVMEDVVDLILNLKQMRFRLHEEGPFTVTLSVSGERKVTGKDFKAPSQVEIVSPDVYIATLSDPKAKLNIDAVVESGLGYVSSEARSKEKVEVGTIALDASFSPVRHVNYEVENMRVGDRTDYNRLRLDLQTDGSLTPREAFKQASEILVNQFRALAEGFAEAEKFITAEFSKKDTPEQSMLSEADAVLKIKIDELKLSSRTMNALREAGIKTVSGLSRKKEATLREIEGLGDKGIQEIKKALGNLGITLKQ